MILSFVGFDTDKTQKIFAKNKTQNIGKSIIFENLQ